MSRSKQGTKKNGEKYRKETKEERRIRLKDQEEAREVGVIVLVCAWNGTIICVCVFALIKLIKPHTYLVFLLLAVDHQCDQFVLSKIRLHVACTVNTHLHDQSILVLYTQYTTTP
mmetsp:Transcript_38466/g.93057  ORF Transcript_38466/g.93057 Transcript_38466/m.93057 type:complete len:115 (+) Transcript_38466:132-476(+)